MTIQQLLSLAVLSGLTAGGLVSVLNKLGVLDLYETLRRQWMPKRCEFCLGFWFSIGFIDLYAVHFGFYNWLELTFDLQILCAVLASTAIAKLINR